MNFLPKYIKNIFSLLPKHLHFFLTPSSFYSPCSKANSARTVYDQTKNNFFLIELKKISQNLLFIFLFIFVEKG